MKARYLPTALADIDSIYRYLSERNPPAASRAIAAIRDSVELLSEFPHLGRLSLVPDAREWVVRGYPYVIVHEVHGDQDEVLVLAVFHTAQDRERPR